MKKTTFILVFLLLTVSLVAREKGQQQKLVSVSPIFVTDSHHFGINLQAMFPIGSNFYIAPEFTYFFPKNESVSVSQYFYKTTTQAININADFHYPLYVGKKSFIAPLVGLGGYIGFLNVKENTSTSSYDNSLSASMFLANFGVAGKFSITDKLFINTQIKYLRPLQEGSGVFSFSAGLGLYF